MNEITFGLARREDLASWMALTRAMRGDFPGLETEPSLADYRDTVTKNIARGTALCAKAGRRVVGALLFSKSQNMLSFLAVDPAYRRRGIAATLIELALGALDPSRNVSVTTFREDDPKGAAPRALYQKFGFVAGEWVEEFGYPNQRFVLHRK